jgi:hypothetical protein
MEFRNGVPTQLIGARLDLMGQQTTFQYAENIYTINARIDNEDNETIRKGEGMGISIRFLAAPALAVVLLAQDAQAFDLLPVPEPSVAQAAPVSPPPGQ